MGTEWEFGLGTEYGDAVRLQVRGGKVSLVRVRKKRDGEYKPEWVSPVVGDAAKKDQSGRLVVIPQGILLGDMRRAVEFAEWLHITITGIAEPLLKKQDKEEDVPF